MDLGRGGEKALYTVYTLVDDVNLLRSLHELIPKL